VVGGSARRSPGPSLPRIGPTRREELRPDDAGVAFALSCGRSS
jgi:hypothetical protein